MRRSASSASASRPAEIPDRSRSNPALSDRSTRSKHRGSSRRKRSPRRRRIPACPCRSAAGADIRLTPLVPRRSIAEAPPRSPAAALTPSWLATAVASAAHRTVAPSATRRRCGEVMSVRSSAGRSSGARMARARRLAQSCGERSQDGGSDERGSRAGGRRARRSAVRGDASVARSRMARASRWRVKRCQTDAKPRRPASAMPRGARPPRARLRRDRLRSDQFGGVGFDDVADS